jgi:CRISPR-associated protein Cmr2
MESRKNWRTRLSWSSKLPEPEGGDHCTIMGEWQELSGFIRSEDRIKQNQFWEQMREVPGVGRLDFREDERLCSIALIKRMFPKAAKDAIGWDVEADRWPSTMYVSALPWLREIEGKKIELARSYANLALETADEKAIRREGVWEQVGGPINLDLLDFLELDGNFYFKSALENQRRTPLKGTPPGWSDEESEMVKEKRRGLLKHLAKLNKKVGRPPSPFYGMLLMDGDSMGALLSDKRNEVGLAVSLALAEFSSQVDTKVKEHHGVTVYAGGDDVLAMLPVTSSIECAVELAICFENAFKKAFNIPELSGSSLRGTISAGLVLANGQYPLRSVLQEAHHILDDVAKNRNGRESIAVSVLKGGGKYCEWVATWPSLEYNSGGTILDSLAEDLGGEGKHFSTSFFFRFREILTMLATHPFWKPGCFIRLSDEFQRDDILRLLIAEYLKSNGGKISADDARPILDKLLAASYHHYRNKDQEYVTNERCLSADGAMLVKFLAEARILAEGGMEE